MVVTGEIKHGVALNDIFVCEFTIQQRQLMVLLFTFISPSCFLMHLTCGFRWEGMDNQPISVEAW